MIDKIFINVCTDKLQAGNLIDKITDMPDFLRILNLAEAQLNNKTEIRDMRNNFFEEKYFLKDLNDMDILDLPDKNTSDKMYNKFHKYYYL